MSLWLRLLPLLLPLPLLAARPVADAHLHYKWSQRDLTSPQQAVDELERLRIVMGVVIGTPAPLALELARLAPQRVVPVWSPYRNGGDWQQWVHDRTVPERARAALATGDWHGIGELHLIGGFVPKLERAEVLHRLMRLAAEYALPLILHTEFSRPDYLLELCTQYPGTRILWAHSGAILPPRQVERVLDACANVWGGLGARDPWRFVRTPIVDGEGRLLPEWRALLLRYPDRFVAGSDPVWPVDRLDSWDQGDSGWRELGRFWEFHRGWLAQLPQDVAARIGCENAVALFGMQERTGCDAAVRAP